MTPDPDEQALLTAFRYAADRVPAYKALLAEARVNPAEVKDLAGFRRLPLLNKQNTFQRFPLRDLCTDGRLAHPSAVLTSSGHSGVFAFGLSGAKEETATAALVDDVLDQVLGVRSRPTLLVNCLPMGVKVRTQACSLAETSVRPDMALALVKGPGQEFDQIVLVGEAALVKRVLEDGEDQGLDWQRLRVHVIVGEEPLAENARKYVERILGTGPGDAEKGLVWSSMGIGELGLNLFFEVPPVAPLICFRRALHEDRELRRAVIGESLVVPMLFTYDPARIHVEFTDEGRLVVTTLDLGRQVPLLRYVPGDCGSFLGLGPGLRPRLQSAGLAPGVLERTPIVTVQGRGQGVLAGDLTVGPEQIKEGIYHDPHLARLTTANFRLAAGPAAASVRIQLAPGLRPSRRLEERFAEAILPYTGAPVTVACEPYEDFRSGMALDYERKFDYLGP